MGKWDRRIFSFDPWVDFVASVEKELGMETWQWIIVGVAGVVLVVMVILKAIKAKQTQQSQE